MSTACLPHSSARHVRARARLGPFVAAIVVLAACGGVERSASRFEASADARRFPIAGEVRAVHAADGTLTVAHEDIAGLMDAMTMDFPVQDPWVLKAAGPGDRISGTLVLDGARSWIEGIAITKADSSFTPGPAGTLPNVAGVSMPDVALVNQDDTAVRPSDWAGHPAVLTFIYTRCPLPDYCPLMMQRMNQIADRLDADRRRDRVWLAAITLDPEFDSPAVLKAFGDHWIRVPEGAGRYDRFALLTGDPEAIRTLASTFHLTYEPQDDEIVHGLRTVVVDAEGRIVRVFLGTDWSVDDVLAAVPAP
jgi:protein SCO1/2